MDNRTLFESLLTADSESEVINILQSENLWEFSTDNWKIFGGDDFAGIKVFSWPKIQLLKEQ